MTVKAMPLLRTSAILFYGTPPEGGDFYDTQYLFALRLLP